MANMHLVTGRAGVEHVTSDDHGALNATIFGTGQYVLNEGNNLSASAISNNTVRVLDGCVMIQGRYARVDGNYVDLTIESGAQGYNRNDLIVARYSRDMAADVEECNLVVIKGAAAVGTASDPEYVTGDLLGETVIQVDMPLYRVPISGINVSAPEALFDIISDNLASLSEKINHINAKDNPHKVTFSQVGAASANHTHTAADVGAAPANHTHTAASIGAAAASHTHTAAQVGAVGLDSNGKATASQISAGIIRITASATLAATHCGQFLYTDSSSAITLTIPNSSNLPVGTEIEIKRWGSGAAKIKCASDIYLRGIGSSAAGETYAITDRYGSAVIKKVTSNSWSIDGVVELA
jgi:hypothetical protein